MKILIFRLKFHWNLFLKVQLKLSQYWFRCWLGTEQANSHYPKQYWSSLSKHICGTRGRWVNALILHKFDRTLISFRFNTGVNNTYNKKYKCLSLEKYMHTLRLRCSGYLLPTHFRPSTETFLMLVKYYRHNALNTDGWNLWNPYEQLSFSTQPVGVGVNSA